VERVLADARAVPQGNIGGRALGLGRSPVVDQNQRRLAADPPCLDLLRELCPPFGTGLLPASYEA